MAKSSTGETNMSDRKCHLFEVAFVRSILSYKQQCKLGRVLLQHFDVVSQSAEQFVVCDEHDIFCGLAE